MKRKGRKAVVSNSVTNVVLNKVNSNSCNTKMQLRFSAKAKHFTISHSTLDSMYSILLHSGQAIKCCLFWPGRTL